MQTYLFCEITVDSTRRTVSVYDEPITEVDVNAQVYAIPDPNSDTKKNIAHLIVNIIKNFPFSGSEKTLGGLCKKVMEKIQIYESEHDISDPTISEFYEKLRAQQYMDGIHYTYKYEHTLSMEDIITTAFTLQIIPKKLLLKYLLKDDDIFSYKLEIIKMIEISEHK